MEVKRKIEVFGIEITTREIIASIAITAFLSFLGVLISGKITQSHMDKVEQYNKAAKIESKDLFEYGMNTNIGNAFVYGDIKAVDSVTYPEIGGEYIYIEKVKEQYTMHTRMVTTTVNGKTRTSTQTYWTWDVVHREDKTCKTISFLDISFPSEKFIIPSDDYLLTRSESSHIRYKYYGVPAQLTGTIYTSLKDKTISDKTSFYNDKTIEKVVEDLNKNGGVVIFWIIWIIMMIACIVGFCYLDNYWMY